MPMHLFQVITIAFIKYHWAKIRSGQKGYFEFLQEVIKIKKKSPRRFKGPNPFIWVRRRGEWNQGMLIRDSNPSYKYMTTYRKPYLD